MRILVIDNYDSFTYNLVQALEALGASCDVVKHDAVDLGALNASRADGAVISPGPGTPETAGALLDALARLVGRIPVLGVCLGHQAIAQHFGARVRRAPRIMHGKTSDVFHDGRGLYRDLPSPLPVARYHSLVVDDTSIPDCLRVTARTAQGELMGLRHRGLPIEGVQFHPESHLSSGGSQLLDNWLEELR